MKNCKSSRRIKMFIFLCIIWTGTSNWMCRRTNEWRKKDQAKFRRRHYKKRHIMNKCTQAVATYSASKRKSRCELYEFILSVLAVSNQGKLRERSSLFAPFRCINHHNSLSHATKNEKCYNISLRWLHHICILKKLKNDRRRKNQNEKCNK